MYIKRNIENKIMEASKQFASITIYGSRQVGKSTLIDELFPKIKKVSLDDIEIRDYALKDPKGFLKYYSTPLVIDEIQKAPIILEEMKIVIDKKKKEWVKTGENELLYIMSGSNQFELQKAVSESLAGRTCIFNLASLSQSI